MNNAHLTEEELQEVASGTNGMAYHMNSHAASCDACLQKIETYRLIFAAVQQQPRPTFDFDLAELVAAQLPSKKPASQNRFLYFIGIAALCLLVIAAIYFRKYAVFIFETAAPVFIYLALPGSFTILVLLAADMYKRYRRKLRILDVYNT